MKRYIKASYGEETSGFSFDFTFNGDYDANAIKSAVRNAFKKFGCYVTAIDFYSVDYDSYDDVAQCGVDFEWSGDYSGDDIEREISSSMRSLGYRVIGNPEFYGFD